MTLDPADLVTEIDTAIDAVPGAATPARAALAQDIFEALWTAVIDHFVDRPFAGSDPGLVPSSDGSTTKFLRGDGTFAVPPGSDGWTYVTLGSDFSMASSTTPSDVTGLGFTPAANTTYIIEGLLLVSTTVATNGVRPGVSWPTGLSGYGAGQIRVTHSVAGDTHGGDSQLSDFSAPAPGQPGTATEAFLARLEALMTTGASPSGDFKVTLRSESTGATHYMRATSYIRYRVQQ